MGALTGTARKSHDVAISASHYCVNATSSIHFRTANPTFSFPSFPLQPPKFRALVVPSNPAAMRLQNQRRGFFGRPLTHGQSLCRPLSLQASSSKRLPPPLYFIILKD